MKEEWKPVFGYIGYYDVSNKGRVRSYLRHARGRYVLSKNPQRILSPIKHTHGYLRVVLWRPCGKSSRYIHRLVLETFVGDCPAGMECCHVDSDKTNNSLENLRWDTHRNNQLNYGESPVLGKPGTSNPAATLTIDTVRRIRELGQSDLTHKQIAERLGLQRRNVSRILQGTRWANVG